MNTSSKNKSHVGAVIPEYAIAMMCMVFALVAIATPIAQYFKTRANAGAKSSSGKMGMAPCSEININAAASARYLNPNTGECL